MSQNIDTDLTSGELLDRALSNIRHLLGNSVSTLKITLEVLVDNYGDFSEEKRIEFLTRAVGQVDMQQHLLESMRNYSRSIVNRVQPIQFNAFWEGWVQEKKEELAQKNIRLRVKDPEATCQVLGDSKVLRLVFNAVLDNAVDALVDTDNPQIDIIALLDDNMQIVIRDNGCGIGPDELKKVFIPFYSKDKDVSGMGLPMVRKLLISMGGSITMDSSAGIGSNVFIRLKQVPVQEQTE